MPDPTLDCPPSVTDMRVNLVGLGGLLVATAWMVQSDFDVVHTAVILMVAAIAPIALLDVFARKVHTRSSAGIRWDGPPQPMDVGRVLTKWMGVLAAVVAVLFIYWIAPEYQGSFYDRFYRFLWSYGPSAIIAGLGYIAYIDGRSEDPHDGYWHVGCAVTGRTSQVDWAKVRDLGRTWVIKGFFVPLMFTYMASNIDELRKLYAIDHTSYMNWHHTLWSFGFLIDVVFATAGYLVTLKVLDTHVRSAQPSMTGWVVAIICYQPFFSLINRMYIFYNNDFTWTDWLAGMPSARLVWGVALLLTLVAFSWSTVAFGARFSNLTNRGVITNGPYRFSKHPAYWSKCVGFWMLFIPFIPHGSGYDVVRDCFWLGVLCGVYWARARTEEIHMSEDPDYVRYALWMNEHGVLAPLGRLLPAMRYTLPNGVSDPRG